MPNRRDLVSETLQVLGVGSAGAPASGQDYAAVDDKVVSFLAMVRAKEIAYIAGPDYIPDEYLLPLARFFAEKFTDVFAVAGEELAYVQARAAQAERDLREMAYPRTIIETVRAEYF